MCGISGILQQSPSQPAEHCDIARMLDVMRHRGPDGNGIHLDGPLGLGHLRLSIIDLATGSQPLDNEDGTIWIVFNGEIYNFLELREQLTARGHRFKTKSDTEVIVHLYEEYGSECVQHLRGMFAFAIWDSRARRLFIARDRLGIKPLYYFNRGGLFAFASEIKALRTLSAAPSELSDESIDALWCFRFIPGELTMFQGIWKLLPGHTLEIDASGRIDIRQYWDLHFNPRQDFSSVENAADELACLLRQTIRQHMISDVPVGFLLSGGMDSSAVLSYAAKETDKDISTFTIGFEDAGVVDERPFARLMARQVNSKHYETTITAGQFWQALPSIYGALEEPICDAAPVGLHFVSRLAREHVKVLLSGEGGDEAFGGYPDYPNQLLLQRFRTICGPFRGIVGSVAQFLGGLFGSGRLYEYGRFLPLKLKDYYWSRAGTPRSHNPRHSGIGYNPNFSKRLDNQSQLPRVTELFSRAANADMLSQMLYLDTKTWLPDYLLLKADKITMANSLELRVPLLDHKVMEFAASLPSEFKVRGRETKRVLKTAFSRILPQKIINRKKVGFPVPYSRWLANELWEKTRDTLMDPNGFVVRYFDSDDIARVLNEHRSRGNRQRELLSLLALALWHRDHLVPGPALS